MLFGGILLFGGIEIVFGVVRLRFFCFFSGGILFVREYFVSLRVEMGWGYGDYLFIEFKF